MGRPKENVVYNFFEIYDDIKSSKCLIDECGKMLRTTHGANLVKHVKHCHPEQYEVIHNLNRDRLNLNNSSRISVSNDDDDDDSKGSDTLEEFMLTDPIFKYFSKEKNRTARCDLCHQTVPLRVVRLKSHMKEMHPDIKPNEDSDTEEQKNSYQEIVYFYESDSGKNESKSNKVAEKLKIREKEILTQPERRKRRFSAIRDFREPVQDAEDEEIANFTKYISCLMKPLPKEVCTQLQMDIINLIMTAKLKCTVKETLNTSTQIENSQPPIIFTVDSGVVKSDLSMTKTQHILLENNSMNDSQNSNIDS